jgi:YD repeat-containing protein
MLFGLMLVCLIIPSLALGATIDYQYDSLDRLVAVRYSDGTRIAYTYDGAGNRLTMVVSACGTLKGDLNNDCDATLQDAVLALRVLAGLPVPSLRSAYGASGTDPTGNATIEPADVLYILQWVSSLRE